MSRYKITLVEPPRIKSVWKRGSNVSIIGTVRQHTPLHTQPIVAAKLREALGDDYEISIIDGRLVDPNHDEKYKTVPYGDGVLEHYQIGLSLDGEEIRDIAKGTDVLGITVNFTQEAHVAVAIGLRARELNPRVKLIYAGSDVRARWEYYLNHGEADAVILGDGEQCGPDLIRALLGKRPIGGIPSIAYVEDGSICKSPIRGIAKMEEVPLPAFDLVAENISDWVESHEGDLPSGVFPPLAYVETSRGCHETCSFCYSAGLRYRMMKTEQVNDYAQHLKTWGFRALMMMADNELTPLLMKKVSGTELSGRDMIIERYRVFREHGFSWEFSNGLQYSLLHDERGFDDELISEMFSNCYRLFTPIEDPLDLTYDKLHGSPAYRKKFINRTNEQIFREHHCNILARIAAHGLRMMTFGLIIGWPGDSPERVRRVADRCRILREAIKSANPNCQTLFTPFIGIPIPGTGSWYDLQRKKLIKEDVESHPEAWQFALTTYGNHEMVDERLKLIAELDGEEAFREWTSTGSYPHQVA
jgi:hopanoid C-3 methylase